MKLNNEYLEGARGRTVPILKWIVERELKKRVERELKKRVERELKKRVELLEKRVERELKKRVELLEKKFGESWWVTEHNDLVTEHNDLVKALKIGRKRKLLKLSEGKVVWDYQKLLETIDDHWDEIFYSTPLEGKFPVLDFERDCNARGWVIESIFVRHLQSHDTPPNPKVTSHGLWKNRLLILRIGDYAQQALEEIPKEQQAAKEASEIQQKISKIQQAVKDIQEMEDELKKSRDQEVERSRNKSEALARECKEQLVAEKEGQAELAKTEAKPDPTPAVSVDKRRQRSIVGDKMSRASKMPKSMTVLDSSNPIESDNDVLGMPMKNGMGIFLNEVNDADVEGVNGAASGLFSAEFEKMQRTKYAKVTDECEYCNVRARVLRNGEEPREVMIPRIIFQRSTGTRSKPRRDA